MKKQLLSLAMLVSVFAVGNVFAVSGEEKKQTQGTESKKGSGSQGPAQIVDGTGSTDKPNAGSKLSTLCGYVKAPFSWSQKNVCGILVGAATTVAAKLVYDYVANKPVEDEEEDVENEEVA